MATLACGPFFSTTGVWVSLFVLLLVKPATYFAFIQAFRYRVSDAVPLSFRRAVGLTAARTLIGAALLGGVALAAGVLSGSDAHPAFLWGGLFLVLSLPVRFAVTRSETWLSVAAWLTR